MMIAERWHTTGHNNGMAPGAPKPRALLKLLRVACQSCGAGTWATSRAPVKCSTCRRAADTRLKLQKREARDATWAAGQEIAVKGRFEPGGRVEWREPVMACELRIPWCHGPKSNAKRCSYCIGKRG